MVSTIPGCPWCCPETSSPPLLIAKRHSWNVRLDHTTTQLRERRLLTKSPTPLVVLWIIPSYNAPHHFTSTIPFPCIIDSDAWSYDIGSSGFTTSLNATIPILVTTSYLTHNSVDPHWRKQGIRLYVMNYGNVYVPSIARARGTPRCSTRSGQTSSTVPASSSPTLRISQRTPLFPRW